MSLFAEIVGIVLLLLTLLDVFETIILPRRITRRFRLSRTFYRLTWRPWAFVARTIRNGNRRESYLSFFGPLSLLALFAVWSVALIMIFALLHWGMGSQLNTPNIRPGFWTDLYMSGSTFFTLGLGDVTPRTTPARALTVTEAGIGFGFLALLISYLPVLYGAFSRREVNISLLDARAGSPPSAVELLRRHLQSPNPERLADYLHAWETWAAELMESHLSYPVLCYFRSQHNNQSWLAALTTILDTCSFLIAHTEGSVRWQAQMTFAISRHAIVDLAQVLNCPPRKLSTDRLPDTELEKLHELAATAKIPMSPSHDDRKLAELRQMYEPYVEAMSVRLLMPVSAFDAKGRPDNWRTSAWARASAEIAPAPHTSAVEDDHA
jgi:hypothetical protein